MSTPTNLSTVCWKLWIKIWATSSVIIVLLTALLLFIDPKTVAAVLAAECLIAVLARLYLHAYWNKFRYSLEPQELRVFSGLWWRKEAHIPYARVTNVNLIQSPWQRRLGLATLKVETAGRSDRNEPEAQLWSQERYEQLRDEILARASSFRRVVEAEADKISRPTEERLLEEIRDLLKGISERTKPLAGGK